MTETSGATGEASQATKKATQATNESPARDVALDLANLIRPEGRAAGHTCVYGARRRLWLQFISEWYLLFLHACYSLAFTLGMVYWLDGQHFTIYDDSIKNLGIVSDGRLTQTAVTTLVSACLVLAKILSASWQSLVAWRCVFILLEKYSLSLSEISCIASLHLPNLSILRPSSSPWSGKVSLRSIAVLVLLFAWPCQLANPIASGSLSWIPADSYTNSSVQLPLLLLDTPPSPQWDWYVSYGNVRDLIVKRSAAYASLSAPINGDQSVEEATIPSARRIAPQIGNKANRTTVSNTTVPIFEIDSFQWVSDITALPDGIQEALHNTSSGYLRVTAGDSPLQQTIGGTSALLKDNIWVAPNRTKIPSPHTVSGKRYAAILVSRPNNEGQGQNYNCRQSESEFNPIPSEVEFVNVPEWNNISQCIAVAELQIRAGVTQCHHDASSNSTCLLSSGVITSNSKTVSPDALVKEVLNIMPEVQALVEALTWHNTTLQHGKLELQLRNSLTQAYQAAWSDLTELLAGSSNVTTPAMEPQLSLLRALVSPWRMYTWLGINALLVLSGILLLVLQSTCEGKTVNDPVVAAILLDSSEVIANDATGLCNATDLGQGQSDADEKLKLFLRMDGGKSDAESLPHGPKRRMHPKLMHKTIS